MTTLFANASALQWRQWAKQLPQFGILPFVILVCLILVVLDGAHIWSLRAKDLAEAEKNTANLAQSLGQHAGDTVRAADVAILGLVQRLGIDGAGPETLQKLRQIMMARLDSFPALGGFIITDATGKCLIIGVPSMPHDCTLAGREDFEFHRTHEDRGSRLNPPVRAIGSGTWMIPLSYRYNTPDGRFAGIVTVDVSMPYFVDYYNTFDIGQDGAIALSLGDGIVLARRPFIEGNVGRSLAGGALFKDILPKSPVGIAEITSTTDGIVRIFAYRKLQPYPLVIAVGVAVDDVLAPWRGQLFSNLATTAILIVTIGFLGTRVAMNVRERQTIESAYRLLADNATDVIMRVGPDAQRLYVSPSIRDLTGHEPEELVNGRHGQLIHPEDRAKWAESFTRASNAGISEATYRVARKDGSYIWVEATRRRLADSGLVVSMRDVSARKQAEDALREAKLHVEQVSQARVTFFTELSHELRSPLNAIIGFADLMERQMMGPIGHPFYLESATDIRTSALHLLALINDILDHAKAEGGYLELNEGEVSVADAISFVMHLLAPRAESGNIALSSAVAARVNAIRGDDRRLKQILLNFGTNAVKFTPAGGRVSFRVDIDANGDLLITVEDTGTGIAEADQARVFEPFAQATTGQALSQEGTGLGLPLTKRLVELHGGSISVNSGLGVGTTMTVRLPAERVIPPRADSDASGSSQPAGS
ncbi:MAG TPA: ATP-binding protein [Stellaceae bacterium]|jgi:PAS domain S-box-containing protein|nr:ATP-binding protein [Stellaceae bacterium]